MAKRYPPISLYPVVMFLASAGPALAEDLSVTEKTFYNVNSFGQLISTLYTYSLSVVGLCVFGMFLYAGIQLLLGGKSARGKAIQIFQDAIIGTLLLYSSYIILNSISPDLVKQRVDSTVSTTNKK